MAWNYCSIIPHFRLKIRLKVLNIFKSIKRNCNGWLFVENIKVLNSTIISIETRQSKVLSPEAWPSKGVGWALNLGSANRGAPFLGWLSAARKQHRISMQHTNYWKRFFGSCVGSTIVLKIFHTPRLHEIGLQLSFINTNLQMYIVHIKRYQNKSFYGILVCKCKNHITEDLPKSKTLLLP